MVVVLWWWCCGGGGVGSAGVFVLVLWFTVYFGGSLWTLVVHCGL